MALINCPECGKEVSDTSYKCPHCGYTMYVPQRSMAGKIARGLFITFNVVMAFTFIMMFVGLLNTPTTDSTGASSAAVGAIGTGMIITIWIIIGLPLGIMSYITRAKAN